MYRSTEERFEKRYDKEWLHFPFVKTFEQFDFGFQPSLDDRQIRELRSLRFIHEASNVIFLGPPGVGKTHLSVALAEEAIRSGLGAYFITAHDLAADLGRAYREGRLDRRMRVYLAPKVLVIDEVGHLPLDDLGATIFFQLVSARYERGSIILTSNKSYGDWGSIFGDSIIATAILDRLLHHSTTINIRGESYRLKDRRKAGLVPPSRTGRGSGRGSLLGLGLRPRPRRPIHEVQGWGIFDRYNGEFSTGIDIFESPMPLRVTF
jgi:DNA replication protein DnaC